MIRVAIIADSPVHRAGLTSVIGAEPGVRIVEATFRDGAVFTGDTETSGHPLSSLDEVDVIVVARGAGSLAELIRPDDSDLDERMRGPATMLLIERMDAGVAHAAYASGASAVLAIDSSAEELGAAVRAIASGLVVIPAGVSAELLASVRGDSTDVRTRNVSTASLTAREREVLALLAQGFANKVIASRLGITEHTVKTHIAAVYEKLDASNRAEVLVAAARQGLVML